MGFETLAVENDSEFAVIRLDRPDQRNAINARMLDELHEAVEEITGDEDINGLILTATEDNFCAGADLKELAEWSSDEAEESSIKAADIASMLETSSTITVAAIEGYCLGGGNELALACDFRVASEDATFGQPEIRLGMIPGFGGTARLPRAVGLHEARSLILSGRKIDAREAEEIGMVDRSIEGGDVVGKAKEFASTFVDNTAPLARAKAKQLLTRSLSRSIDEAVRVERTAFSELFGTHDQKEGVEAFLEKRDPEFTGE